MWLFLIGTALAIPLSILGNIYTDPVRARIDKRNQRRTQERVDNEAAFARDVEWYAGNSAELTQKMTAELVRIGYFAAIFGVFAGVSAGIGQAASFAASTFNRLDAAYDELRTLSTALFLASQVIVVLGALITLNVARDAYRLYTGVRNITARAGEEVPKPPPPLKP